MKVAIYLRKSRGEIEDLEKHKSQLLEIAEKHNYSYDIYEEIGSSDTLEERPEFMRLLDNIQKYKKIFIVALDRLSRNQLHQSQIIQILKDKKVEVMTPTRTYNFDQENDIITSDFELLLARQEYRLIKKRLHQGKIDGAKQGKFVNGPTPLGYKYNKETKQIEIDEEQAKVYRYIVDKVLSGEYSAYSLAFELNKQGVPTSYGGQWNNTGVYRLLLSEFHLGKVKYQGEWYDSDFTPLKTEEEHHKINMYFNKVGKKPRKNNKRTFALSQLIKCECCGRTMTLGLAKRDNTTYLKPCWYRDPVGNKCGNYGMKTDPLLKQIKYDIEKHIDEIKEQIKQGQNKLLEEKKNEYQNEINMLEQKVRKKNEKIARIIDMTENGLYTISDAKNRIDTTKNDIIGLQNKIEVLKYDIKVFNRDLQSQLVTFEEVYHELQDNIAEEEINFLLRKIIKQIKYRKDGNKISMEIEYL